MTGWRLGWMVAPPAFIAELSKVIEYNTSCAPRFVQAGALAALGEEGEAAIAALMDRLARSRRLLVDGLRRLPGVEVPEARGAMYAFFRVAGRPDDMALAHALVTEARLGLAPGSAFGPEGEGWLRSPPPLSCGDGRLRPPPAFSRVHRLAKQQRAAHPPPEGVLS
jgi:aspartate/methionine/tyrosine aminotransferase